LLRPHWKRKLPERLVLSSLGIVQVEGYSPI